MPLGKTPQQQPSVTPHMPCERVTRFRERRKAFAAATMRVSDGPNTSAAVGAINKITLNNHFFLCCLSRYQ